MEHAIILSEATAAAVRLVPRELVADVMSYMCSIPTEPLKGHSNNSVIFFLNIYRSNEIRFRSNEIDIVRTK